jgi:two-component system sensor histidine kinase VicK
MEALKRGVKIRIITEVTKDNIEHCKEGMKYVSELRHMDGISGTFVVGDKHYLSNIVAENIGSFQCVHSNIKSFVDQQKYIFENLWRNAIPATEKIKELQKNENEEFSQIVNSPEEIKQLFLSYTVFERRVPDSLFRHIWAFGIY